MGGFVDQRVNAKGEVAPPRPRVYSDKLPQNVEQDKSEMVGPIFAIADTRTFGMESDLHHKIVRSEYFKCLYVFKTFSKVVDVIQKKVTCVAPWTYRGTQKRGRWKTPSSAFCLLLKLFHLRLTQVQVEELLNHPDSPYIRALGMLYVRFGADAASLWKLLGPYCDDNQVFKPQGNEETTCTIGEFAQRLLTQTEPFFETPLPRVPKQLELRLLRHLQLSEEMVARARRNTRFFGTEKLRKGATGFLCCAQNFFAVDDDKPLTLVWRTDGVIESVLDPRRDRGANTQHAAYPTFQVRFQQDDSNALAKLGMIEFPPENDDDWKERESRQAAAELLLKKKRIKHDETSSKREEKRHRRDHGRRRRSRDDDDEDDERVPLFRGHRADRHSNGSKISQSRGNDGDAHTNNVVNPFAPSFVPGAGRPMVESVFDKRSELFPKKKIELPQEQQQPRRQRASSTQKISFNLNPQSFTTLSQPPEAVDEAPRAEVVETFPPQEYGSIGTIESGAHVAATLNGQPRQPEDRSEQVTSEFSAAELLPPISTSSGAEPTTQAAPFQAPNALSTEESVVALLRELETEKEEATQDSSGDIIAREEDDVDTSSSKALPLPASAFPNKREPVLRGDERPSQSISAHGRLSPPSPRHETEKDDESSPHHSRGRGKRNRASDDGEQQSSDEGSSPRRRRRRHHRSRRHHRRHRRRHSDDDSDDDSRRRRRKHRSSKRRRESSPKGRRRRDIRD